MSNITRVALLVLALAPATTAMGQQPSPYAGQQNRPIKALSDEEILSYLNGDGMGYAKAAELNRYPGPRHVLDLAPKLDLTEPQRQRLERIYQVMHADAVRLGTRIIQEEAALDSLFESRTIDQRHLRATVEDLARLSGELRLTHLRAHLEVTRILAPDQIIHYVALRGYAADSAQAGHEHH